jgi:ATP-dependent DNA helicase RecQ
MDLERLLHHRFGHPAFRPGQDRAVAHVADGNDALVVMPTGHGKSICYQLPALARGGTTLVVSPLIALMKDQVDGLQARGIRATLINSSVDWESRVRRVQQMTEGAFDLVYVAPERFTDRFMAALANTDVRLLAVDEAHCISQWGHDFRPDYLRLGKVRKALGSLPTVALTATATPAVQADILEMLGIPDAQRFITGFDRENLALEIVQVRTPSAKDIALPRLLADQPALVYCATRKHVTQVTELLSRRGISALAYHGGLPHPVRQQVQDDFIGGRVPVVVATNAFGMGVDKADIRTIVHYDLPGTLEAYTQEIGRAGRDGRPARAVLLFRSGDRRLQEFFIEGSHPPAAMVHRVYETLLASGESPLWWHPDEVAERAGTEPRMASSCLSVLRQRGCISRASTRDGQTGQVRHGIALTDPGAPLRLDEADMKQRRDHAYDQLDKIVAYGDAPCLRRAILDHFGEQPAWERCGRCTGCSTGRPMVDSPRDLSPTELEHVRKLLACMARMRRPFSAAMIAKVATGSRNKTVLAFGFERLSTYGLLNTWSQSRVEDLLGALVQAGAVQAVRITQEIRGQARTYQNLQLTDLGRAVMSGAESSLALVLPEAQAAPAHSISFDVDADLLSRLRAVRLSLAREAGVPAYVVAPNKTLIGIAELRPTSETALSEVHGMGPGRIARYGPAFVDAVRGWTQC